MLHSLLRFPPPSPPYSIFPYKKVISSPCPEDFFYSALGIIFPDDAPALHGDPGSVVIYTSKQFGEITLRLSAPDSEDDRRLFAQYLWNAGVLMAEIVSGNVGLDESRSTLSDAVGDGDGGKIPLTGTMMRKRDEDDWNVFGETVLELGAGSGLAGIVSALAGAGEVVISDYPSPGILSTLETNCAKNIPSSLSSEESSASSNSVRVVGHEWGIIDDEFSKANARRFTRILAADCLWMVGEHQNLVTSMLHFLSGDDDGSNDDHDHEKKNEKKKKKKQAAQVWIVAGFHTGRATLASFFKVAHDAGLEVKRIWERDVQGNEREWVKEPDQSRPKEDIASLKKWLVVAILGRK